MGWGSGEERRRRGGFENPSWRRYMNNTSSDF
jgi:hypothetical protein